MNYIRSAIQECIKNNNNPNNVFVTLPSHTNSQVCHMITFNPDTSMLITVYFITKVNQGLNFISLN